MLTPGKHAWGTSFHMNIILGTASVQRQAVFREMGYKDFEVMTADIDEKSIRFDDPRELTLALARAKASALRARIIEPAILITADQVVESGGEMREKPCDEKQAREYLRTCHEFPVHIINGVAVTDTKTGKQVTAHDSATVIFRRIPEEIIERLIREGNVYSWAGAFAVENPVFVPYVENIIGEDGSVRGLPKALVARLIEDVLTPGKHAQRFYV